MFGLVKVIFFLRYECAVFEQFVLIFKLQPIIPLPDKVPLTTGEENEEVLYSHRAKLYRFAFGEWKERGVGDMKILKHKETHKIRYLI